MRRSSASPAPSTRCSSATAHLGKSTSVSVVDVADHLHVTSTFITRVVKKLVSLGLLEKEADETDRRRVRLTLTT